MGNVFSAIDWKETSTAHVFEAEVPGLKKEGGRSPKTSQKVDTWHRAERNSGSFSRTFNLPDNANIDHVKAAMEDGLLTVTVPEEQQPNNNKDGVRSIDISG